MKFAVGHADFYDNDLIIEIVEADNLKLAIQAHSRFHRPSEEADNEEWFRGMPDDLEGIKQFFFDADTLVSATEIPSC
jgi:hypothetical protein